MWFVHSICAAMISRYEQSRIKAMGPIEKDNYISRNHIGTRRRLAYPLVHYFVSDVFPAIASVTSFSSTNWFYSMSQWFLAQKKGCMLPAGGHSGEGRKNIDSKLKDMSVANGILFIDIRLDISIDNSLKSSTLLQSLLLFCALSFWRIPSAWIKGLSSYLYHIVSYNFEHNLKCCCK